MKRWFTPLRLNFRDIVLTGFGGWIVWKQVYASDPNATLILVGFACMVPSARAAIISIWSGPGSSSERRSSQESQDSQRSSSGDTDELEGKKELYSSGGLVSFSVHRFVRTEFAADSSK